MPTPPTRARIRPSRAATVAVVLVLALGACSGSGSRATPPPSTAAPVPATTPTTPTTPTSTPDGATTTPPFDRTIVPENVAFDYEHMRADTDLRSLGRVVMVVTARQRDPHASDAIHRIGAAAYRYVQTYWFPPRPDRDGVDLKAHPEWGFCAQGSTAVTGRRTADGETLTYLDMNERAAHNYYALLFARLKSEGWDGVFLDRGYASLTGIDSERAGIWNKVSTCTEDPVVPNATFADSYLGMAAEAHRAGLKLMVNYGVSPFDPLTPLRPDPTDPACAQQPAPECRHLADGWRDVDWFLDEAVTHPRDIDWAKDFTANSRGETEPDHGGRVVGLITDAILQGDTSRAAVFYAWSRAKLFAVPIAVGTGSGGCPKAKPGTVCNRRLSFADLASTTLGPPLDRAPTSSDCTPGSTTLCVWVRRYTDGVVVVNAQGRPVRTEVDLGVDGCRRMTDVFVGTPIAGGDCVRTVTLDLAPWAGRPLRDR